MKYKILTNYGAYEGMHLSDEEFESPQDAAYFLLTTVGYNDRIIVGIVDPKELLFEHPSLINSKEE